MKNLKYFIVLIFFPLFFSACNLSSGKIITEKREVDAFSELDISGMVDVEYKIAEDYFIEVESGKNVLENITTEVIDGVLEINTLRWLSNIDDAKVFVYSPMPVKKITTREYADLNIGDDFIEDSLEIFIVGQGNIKIDHLKVNDLDINSVAGGVVSLAGEGETCFVKSSVNTEVNLADFVCNEMQFENSAELISKINVKDKLVANIMFSGDLEYIGEPITDFHFWGLNQLGDIISLDTGVISSQCDAYGIDTCPNYCQLCPSCPDCSALSCLSPNICEELGFSKETQEEIK